MLHKFRIALAAIFLAAGAVAAVDSASALPADGGGKQIPLGDGVDQNDRPFRDFWPYGGP
jgi:hypothetical protein